MANDVKKNDAADQSQTETTVDSVFDKWRNVIMAIVWIAILIAVLLFIGQMLLWRFAPDAWESIFGVEPVSISEYSETTAVSAEEYVTKITQETSAE